MTTLTDPADLAHYSAALDEVYRQRCALVYEAQVLEEYLTYATLPKALRRTVKEQVARMRAAARGETREAYAEVPSLLAQELLRAAGGSATLTRSAWEADR